MDRRENPFNVFLLKLNRKKFLTKIWYFLTIFKSELPWRRFQRRCLFLQTNVFFKENHFHKKFEFLLQCIHYLFSCRPIIICLRQKFVFSESGKKIDQIRIRKFSNVNLSSSSLSNNWSSILQIQITLKNTYTKVIIPKS